MTVKLPGIETAPLESIVRRLTPPVTKDILSAEGLIRPVFGSPLNFKLQLDTGGAGKGGILPHAKPRAFESEVWDTPNYGKDHGVFTERAPTVHQKARLRHGISEQES